MDKRITINDIAKELSVSKGTVDRAIHNRPDISAQTKQKVLDYIKKHGYKPDLIARSLSLRSKPCRIGMIFSKEPSFFWNAVEEGACCAENEFSDHNLSILIKRTQTAEGCHKAALELIAQNVQGIAIAPKEPKAFRDSLELIVRSGIPFITFNDDIINCRRIFYVGPALFEGGRIAGELTGLMLRCSGAAAVVEPLQQSAQTASRARGYLEKLTKDYGSIEVCGRFTVNASLQNKTPLCRILPSLRNADAIYDTSGMLIKAIADLKANGLIDKSTVLIGHELSPEAFAALHSGFFSAVISQDPYAQGYNAAKCLFEYLHHSLMPEQGRLLVPHRILTRENMPARSRI